MLQKVFIFFTAEKNNPITGHGYKGEGKYVNCQKKYNITLLSNSSYILIDLNFMYTYIYLHVYVYMYIESWISKYTKSVTSKYNK